MITCRTKTIFPFNQYFLNMLKAVLGGRNRRLPKIYFKELDSDFFSSRLTDNGKILYFPWYFGDLYRVETGVSEEGINSMKTLPKLSKSF